MAGETVKSEALCLAIHPWSRTSHIVRWLTPHGQVTTLVKGAVRPKSAFLGQYDLNYRCEILYYARARGDLHALREATPLDRRDSLRTSYRALVLADYLRAVVRELAPEGPDAADWFSLLDQTLTRLSSPGSVPTIPGPVPTIPGSVPTIPGSVPRDGLFVEMLEFELKALDLAGLTPSLADSDGVFHLRGERQMQLSPAVVACLRNPRAGMDLNVLMAAEKALGVFFSFHLDCARDVRRAVLNVLLR